MLIILSTVALSKISISSLSSTSSKVSFACLDIETNLHGFLKQ